ncbi:hypothetical protein KJ693_10420 [bacterium]|nr:hypothetical protein [bacterium]MBU1615703.1 hypothetical protein [bacterium]
MKEFLMKAGEFASYIFLAISFLACGTAVYLFILDHKRRKAFEKERKEQSKTITSLGKEKERLTKEKELLMGNILGRLDDVVKKNEAQASLVEMIKKYEKVEEERRDNLMNWLEYKTEKWEERIEDRVNNRLAKLQRQLDELILKTADRKNHHGDQNTEKEG